MNTVNDIEEFISEKPSWLVMHGNAILATIVGICLLLAWKIEYPEIVRGSVKITNLHPPVKLYSKINGALVKLNVNDGELIEVGQVIAVLDNASSYDDMFYMDAFIARLDTAISIRGVVENIILKRNLNLGPIQSDYADLVLAIENYKIFFKTRYFRDKVRNQTLQFVEMEKITSLMNQRDIILNKQLELELWNDSIHNLLLKEKVISRENYSKIKEIELNKHLDVIDNSRLLVENGLASRERLMSIDDIQHESLMEESSRVNSIKSIAKKIRGKINEWKDLYLVVSPIKGKISFFSIRKVSQFVISNSPIFLITPSTNEYEIIANIPLFGAGRVKSGQKSIIRIFQFPYLDFGELESTVLAVTNVAIDSSFVVKLASSKVLITTRKFRIENIPELFGSVDIYTDDKNLLQRFFEKFAGFRDR